MSVKNGYSTTNYKRQKANSIKGSSYFTSYTLEVYYFSLPLTLSQETDLIIRETFQRILSDLFSSVFRLAHQAPSKS